MSAKAVEGQFMGEPAGGPAKNLGWRGLAPQPDNDGNRWSQFRIAMKSEGGGNVDRQTMVEALGTLVFEATLRIKAVTDVEAAKAKTVDAKLGETVLGHAAVASGMGIANHDLLVEIRDLLKSK
ncbi:lysin A, peptidase domain [Gordonia phage Jumbo]|uniref:Lysin A, peptidase domain n=1 Tax=Gordonia phage Jumbo TaxID=1887650 RepID=A0A1B3B0K2_9CAUD|nr:peptidase [Gordonia phage Jumbo]AOE44543.1 lysin A, peptidase domain [Gordonia phage Jumbo]